MRGKEHAAERLEAKERALMTVDARAYLVQTISQMRLTAVCLVLVLCGADLLRKHYDHHLNPMIHDGASTSIMFNTITTRIQFLFLCISQHKSRFQNRFFGKLFFFAESDSPVSQTQSQSTP